jgi:hypothetical protein
MRRSKSYCTGGPGFQQRLSAGNRILLIARHLHFGFEHADISQNAVHHPFSGVLLKILAPNADTRLIHIC